jgi:CBS domain containing-hemolysin-like protein
MPVYRKDPSHIVGYVSSKEIIMNYLAHDIADKIPLKTLVKGKIVYKAVRIYSDAVAV